MKQFFSIKLSKGEKIAAIVIAVWIIASLLVPLPNVNSLGM